MKFGIRKPSLKKSISARTTGRAKRAVKRAVNPLYGKKGMGWVNNPKKAAYNKVYNRTSTSATSSMGCLATFLFSPFLIIFYLFKFLCLGILWLGEKISGLLFKSDSVTDTIPNATPLTSNSPVSDLSAVSDRWSTRVPVIQGCPQIYGYNKVPVVNVDPDILRLMLSDNLYSLELTLCSDGSVALLYNANYVGKLAKRIDICADWLKRGDPIRCEMTGFKPGNEHVTLCFYRDEATRLKDHETAIVKLTTYAATAKQECIEILKPGEALICREDCGSDCKVDVLDYSGDPIGRLPKKFATLFLDKGLSAIFFDHVEKDEMGRLVPYVKIYV